MKKFARETVSWFRGKINGRKEIGGEEQETNNCEGKIAGPSLFKKKREQGETDRLNGGQGQGYGGYGTSGSPSSDGNGAKL